MPDMLFTHLRPAPDHGAPWQGGNVAGDVRARCAPSPGPGPDRRPPLGARAVRDRHHRARVQPVWYVHQPAPGLPGTLLDAASLVADDRAARRHAGAVLRGVLDPGPSAGPQVRLAPGSADLPAAARCGADRAR